MPWLQPKDRREITKTCAEKTRTSLPVKARKRTCDCVPQVTDPIVNHQMENHGLFFQNFSWPKGVVNKKTFSWKPEVFTVDLSNFGFYLREEILIEFFNNDDDINIPNIGDPGPFHKGASESDRKDARNTLEIIG